MEVSKPQKPDEELVGYVTQLEVPLDTETDDSVRRLLVRNAFKEIRKREAALATHKKGSLVLEKLLRLANDRQLAGAAARMRGYVSFLAGHRFGSHVLQTLLTRVAARVVGLVLPGSLEEKQADRVKRAGAAEDDSDSDSDSEDEDVKGGDAATQLAHALDELAAEVEGRWDEVIFDPCATHVFRSLLLALAGAADIRGAKGVRGAASESGRDLASAGSAAAATGGGSGVLDWLAVGAKDDSGAGSAASAEAPKGLLAAPVDAVPSAWIDRLLSLARAMSALPGSALRDLACNSHSSPCLQLLVTHLVRIQRAFRLDAKRARRGGAAEADVDDRAAHARAIDAVVSKLFADMIAPLEDAEGRAELEAIEKEEDGEKEDEEEEEDEDEEGGDGRHRHRRRRRAGAATLSGRTFELLCEDGGGSHMMEVVLSVLDETTFVLLARSLLTPRGDKPTTEKKDKKDKKDKEGKTKKGTKADATDAADASDAADAAATEPADPRASPAASAVFRMAWHAKGNFVVQQLVTRIGRDRLVDLRVLVFRELLPHIGDLLRDHREGIVGAMVESLAVGKKPDVDAQRTLVHAILHAAVRARCPGGERGVVAWLLGLSGAPPGASAADAATYSTAHAGHRGAAAPVSLSGARLVRSLLTFHSSVTRPVLESLLTIAPEGLAAMACDPSGSRHVLEPVWTLPEDLTWARARLFSALKGHWLALAVDRFGCWVAEKAFAAVDAHKKLSMAEELAAGERTLQGSRTGRHVARLCRLDHFKNNKRSWMAVFEQSKKRVELFRDLLGPRGETTAETSAMEAVEAAETDAREKSKRAGGGGGRSGTEEMDELEDEAMTARKSKRPVEVGAAALTAKEKKEGKDKGEKKEKKEKKGRDDELAGVGFVAEPESLSRSRKRAREDEAGERDAERSDRREHGRAKESGAGSKSKAKDDGEDERDEDEDEDIAKVVIIERRPAASKEPPKVSSKPSKSAADGTASSAASSTASSSKKPLAAVHIAPATPGHSTKRARSDEASESAVPRVDASLAASGAGASTPAPKAPKAPKTPKTPAPAVTSSKSAPEPTGAGAAPVEDSMAFILQAIRESAKPDAKAGGAKTPSTKAGGGGGGAKTPKATSVVSSLTLVTSGTPSKPKGTGGGGAAAAAAGGGGKTPVEKPKGSFEHRSRRDRDEE